MIADREWHRLLIYWVRRHNVVNRKLAIHQLVRRIQPKGVRIGFARRVRRLQLQRDASALTVRGTLDLAPRDVLREAMTHHGIAAPHSHVATHTAAIFWRSIYRILSSYSRPEQGTLSLESGFVVIVTCVIKQLNLLPFESDFEAA